MSDSCPSCGTAIVSPDTDATLVRCPGCAVELVPPGARQISVYSREGDDEELACHATVSLSPEMLKRYRFERLLGAGAMGVVYRAHDNFRDAPVAIKVLKLSGAN